VRKLILHFDVTDSDVFADQSLDTTYVMSLFQREPNKPIYFQDHELMLKTPVRTGSWLRGFSESQLSSSPRALARTSDGVSP
jgi:hypothetical protein